MRRILIVEDDGEIAMLERDYLEIAGFKADIVSNGDRAAEAALTGDPRSGPGGRRLH